MAAESRSTIDTAANVATDLAKVLELHKSLRSIGQSRVPINSLRGHRKSGLIHRPAHHSSMLACETLTEIETTPMPKMSAIARERGFVKLADKFRAYEESLSVAPVANVVVSVVLPSGETLLQDLQQQPSETVSAIMTVAGAALCAKGLPGNVSGLCTTDGIVLEPMDSLLAAGLGKHSVLTAVVSSEEESLQIIENHFHNLIMERNGCPGSPSTLIDRGFTFPSLKAQLAKDGQDWRGTGEYYAVPGMYGGFDTHIASENSHWKLTCNSWCRVCEGSEQTHEITVAGVRRIPYQPQYSQSTGPEYSQQDYKKDLELLLARLEDERQVEQEEEEEAEHE